MDEVAERSHHRPLGIFDVRDHYREQRNANGIAATVSGQVRFAVTAVVTPRGRLEPVGWVLDTRPTLSGLSAFLGRVVETRPTQVVRSLPPDATTVEIRVSCKDFQPRDVTFVPGSGRLPVNLEPAVGYPFDRLAATPDQRGPTLIRGTVRDEQGRGLTGSVISVAEGVYDYRTEADGAWVIVLPDHLPWVSSPAGGAGGEHFAVQVRLTLPGTAAGRTVTVLADGAAVPWSVQGLALTRAVTAVRGTTTSLPDLRLRLS